MKQKQLLEQRPLTMLSKSSRAVSTSLYHSTESLSVVLSCFPQSGITTLQYCAPEVLINQMSEHT